MMRGIAIAAVEASIEIRAMNQKSLFSRHFLLLVLSLFVSSGFWLTLENNRYQTMLNDILKMVSYYSWGEIIW